MEKKVLGNSLTIYLLFFSERVHAGSGCETTGQTDCQFEQVSKEGDERANSDMFHNWHECDTCDSLRYSIEERPQIPPPVNKI